MFSDTYSVVAETSESKKECRVEFQSLSNNFLDNRSKFLNGLSYKEVVDKIKIYEEKQKIEKV